MPFSLIQKILGIATVISLFANGIQYFLYHRQVNEAAYFQQQSSTCNAYLNVQNQAIAEGAKKSKALHDKVLAAQKAALATQEKPGVEITETTCEGAVKQGISYVTSNVKNF